MHLRPELNSKSIFGMLLLAGIYFVAGKLGLALSLVADNVTLIWPPTGIALATLLIYGPRYWPGIFLGALTLNFTTSAPAISCIGIAFGNTGEALVGYWLLQQVTTIDISLRRVRDVLQLILLGGGGATLVSALVGAISLVAGNVIPLAAVPHTLLLWWMGDALGAIVFAPMLLAWNKRSPFGSLSGRLPEFFSFQLISVIIAVVSIAGFPPLHIESIPPVAFVLPMLIWGAIRFGQRGVTFTVLLFVMLALWGILNGKGLLSSDNPTLSLTVLWAYANILSISGLIFSAFVRELKEAHADVRLSASVFKQLPSGVAITDLQENILTTNAALEEMLGLSKDLIIGKTLRAFVDARHTPAELDEIKLYTMQQGFWEGELWGVNIQGEAFPTWATITVSDNLQGELSHFIITITDITERKRIEARNRELAEHDALTGLPNRMLFMDRLHQSILYASRQHGQLAVMFLDLDHFKVINDSLGHDVGDEMLQQLAERLTDCMREEDTVARQGGDEFVILVQDVHQDMDVALVAQKILDAVARPFEVHGYALDITASIGIAMYPRDGEDPNTLLKHADLAMYHGKEGRASYHFYGQEMDRRAQARLSVEHKLRRALEHNEFLLYYQPQVDALSGKITAIEALLRWHNTDGQIVGPSEFIGIAEETGLILPIGSWVLHEAAAQVQRWRQQGLHVPRLSINVSARQIWHGGFEQELQLALDHTGLDPTLLEVELTESVFLRSSEEVSKTLARFDQLGIRVAIDDFGTGYSSLGYLRRFPVDTLKLDKTFVQDLPDNQEAAAITSAVISLAQGLGITVVAEGVEQDKQYAFLREKECHHIQGFYFSKPLTVDACALALQAGKLTGKNYSE